MKKFVFLLVICLMLTGCGMRTLKCVKKNDSEAGTLTYEITMLFQKNKLISTTVDNCLKLDKDYKDYSNVLINRFKNVLKKYDDKKGIKTSIDESKDTIKTSIEFNLDKMDDKSKEELGFARGTKKSIKKYYEKDGFKCK